VDSDGVPAVSIGQGQGFRFVRDSSPARLEEVNRGLEGQSDHSVHDEIVEVRRDTWWPVNVRAV
jgi:hypothetical protein